MINMDAITIDDCICNFQFKQKAVLIKHGKVIGFEYFGKHENEDEKNKGGEIKWKFQ